MQTNYPLVRRIKETLLGSAPRPTRIALGAYRGVVRRMAPHNTVQVRWGLWERETYGYLRKALSAAWVIDVGSGWGEMCALFAMKSRAAPIYAVDPKDADKTADTLALSGVADKVTVLGCLIGAKPDLPLDDIAVSPGRGFIKIDVDGAEMDVFESGRTLLAEHKPMILLETHSAELERQCQAFLEGLGYRCTIIPNAWWRKVIPERRAIDHNRWMWAE